MSTSNYLWKSDDGVWRRKLGSMESFYLAISSPEGLPVHWMIGCSVSLKYHGSPLGISDSLLDAWKSLRPYYPNIAATVDSETKEFVVEAQEEEEKWLKRSFKLHPIGSSSALFEDFRSQFYITLHFLEETNELLIQAPHSLLDGRGMLYLFNAIFTALSKQPPSYNQDPDFSNSKQPNLTRPFDDWLNMSIVPSEKNNQDAQTIFQRVLGQENPIRIPGIEFDRIPDRPTHQELLLDEGTTKKIISACKQRGVSVTSAWHAALALTVQKLQAAAGEEGTTYAQVTTIDLRRYFSSPFIPALHSIGSLQTGFPFAISLPPRSSQTSNDQKNTFMDIAQDLHSQYRSPFAFTATPTNSEPDFGFLTPLVSTFTQLLSIGAMPPSSTPSLSSMGLVSDILHDKYGEWEIQNFWISSTMMTGDFQIYCWTFKDRMTFSVCWNKAFYSMELVNSVLDGTREEMLSGLGVA